MPSRYRAAVRNIRDPEKAAVVNWNEVELPSGRRAYPANFNKLDNPIHEGCWLPEPPPSD